MINENDVAQISSDAEISVAADNVEKAEMTVSMTVDGKPFDPEHDSLPRLIRRTLASVRKAQVKQFGKYVHPETGERPRLVINIEMKGRKLPQVTTRLVTDDPKVREWLKSKGIVIGEEIKSPVDQVVSPVD